MSDTTSDDAPKTPPRDPYKGLRRAAIALIALAVIWLLFGQAVPRLLSPAEPPPPPKTDLVAPVGETLVLQERINRLENKIVSLEDALLNASGGDDSLTEARIAALQSKIETLQQAPPAKEGAPDDARVAQLEKVTKTLETQLGEIQNKNQQQLSALSVLGEMKDTIQRGEAFGEPLQQLTLLAQDNERAQELLKQLAPFTRSGATLTQLQAMFENTVPKALAENETDSALKRNLRSLISIRKVGEKQTGNDDESVIARAEAKLERGEVDASVKELAALSPSAGESFATWINKAKIWMYLRTKIDALQLALIEPTPSAPAAPATPPAPPPAEASPSAGSAMEEAVRASTPLPPLPPLPGLLPPAAEQSFPPARE